MTGTGTITSGASTFGGTLTASGGPYTNGVVQGSFFGPKAVEFGYSFALTGPGTGVGASGAVVGTK